MSGGRGRVVAEFRFEEAFEGVEVDGIELAEALHPDGGRAECVGFQFAPFYAAAFFLRDEARIGKDGEVFGDGGKRHGEGVGDVGDGHVVFEQHRQDRAARGIGQRGEDGVERVGRGWRHAGGVPGSWRIVNRLVEYAPRGQWGGNGVPQAMRYD